MTQSTRTARPTKRDRQFTHRSERARARREAQLEAPRRVILVAGQWQVTR